MIVELGGRIEVCIYKLLTVFCDHSNPHDLSVIATFAFACFKFTESVIFFVEERAKFFQQPYVSCMVLVIWLMGLRNPLQLHMQYLIHILWTLDLDWSTGTYRSWSLINWINSMISLKTQDTEHCWSKGILEVSCPFVLQKSFPAWIFSNSMASTIYKLKLGPRGRASIFFHFFLI